MTKLLEDAKEAGFYVSDEGFIFSFDGLNINSKLAKFAALQQPQWIDASIEKPSIQEGKDYSKNVFCLYKDYKGNLNLSIFKLIVVNELENGYEWAWAKLGNSCADLREYECEFDDDYEVMYWMPIDLPEPPITTEVT